MNKGRDDAVSTRAYQIWEAEGRPEGRGEAHWRQAERDVYAAEGAPGKATGMAHESAPSVHGAGRNENAQSAPEAPKSAGAGI